MLSWICRNSFRLPRKYVDAFHFSTTTSVSVCLNALPPPKYAKAFLSPKARRAAPISVSSALSRAPVYTARPWIRLVQCACLWPRFRRYSLHLLTDGWPGWVDVSGWLHLLRWFAHQPMVTHPSTNRVWRWLTSLMRLMTLPTKPNCQAVLAHYTSMPSVCVYVCCIILY